MVRAARLSRFQNVSPIPLHLTPPIPLHLTSPRPLHVAPAIPTHNAPLDAPHNATFDVPHTPALGDPDATSPESDSSDDDPLVPTYEVEKIIKNGVTKEGEAIYYIKWKGFRYADNTWETEDNLSSDLVADFKRSAQYREPTGKY
jgi:hypothetical protein